MPDQALVRIVGETVLVLFIYIALGFMMRKIGIIDDNVNKGLGRIFLIVALPAAILNSMFNQRFNQELLVNVVIVFFTIIAICFLFAVLGMGVGTLFRLPRERKGMFAFAMVFGNTGIMGLPVIGALWPGLGLFYGAIVIMAIFVMLPTMGVWLAVKSSKDLDGQPLKFKLKPDVTLFAALIGLTYFITQNYIPEPIIHFIRPAVFDGVGGGPVGRVIGGTAAVMTPLSMFMVGAFLATGKVSDLWGEISVAALAAVKLLIVPASLFFVLRMFITDPILLGVLVVQSAMPTAALTTIYAENYKADPAYASRIVFFTTAFSLATIPIVALLLG